MKIKFLNMLVLILVTLFVVGCSNVVEKIQIVEEQDTEVDTTEVDTTESMSLEEQVDTVTSPLSEFKAYLDEIEDSEINVYYDRFKNESSSLKTHLSHLTDSGADKDSIIMAQIMYTGAMYKVTYLASRVTPELAKEWDLPISYFTQHQKSDVCNTEFLEENHEDIYKGMVPPTCIED